MQLSDFMRRYWSLYSDSLKLDRERIHSMMNGLGHFPKSYYISGDEIHLQSHILPELEFRRKSPYETISNMTNLESNAANVSVVNTALSMTHPKTQSTTSNGTIQMEICSPNDHEEGVNQTDAINGTSNKRLSNSISIVGDPTMSSVVTEETTLNTQHEPPVEHDKRQSNGLKDYPNGRVNGSSKLDFIGVPTMSSVITDEVFEHPIMETIHHNGDQIVRLTDASTAMPPPIASRLSPSPRVMGEPPCTDERSITNGSYRPTSNLIISQNEALDEARHEAVIAQQARARADQLVESLREELARLEDDRDEELETLRASHQSRLQKLEAQLDMAQKECTTASRIRMQLEHDLATIRLELQTTVGAVDLEVERKLRKELKKYQTALAEKEAMLDQLLQQQEQPSDYQNTVRQLRNRIDELDELNETANRQKRAIQAELDESQTNLQTEQRMKRELGEQLSSMKHNILDLHGQMQDYQEATREAQTLYQTALNARTVDATTIDAQQQDITDLLQQRDALRDEVDQLRAGIDSNGLERKQSNASTDRLEARVRELEERLESERLTRNRLQNTLERTRDSLDQLTIQRDQLTTSSSIYEQTNRKLARQLREAQQAEEDAVRRAQNAQRRATDAVDQSDSAQRQVASLQAQLNAVTRRTSDLQSWLRGADAMNMFDGDSDDTDDASCTSPAMGDGESLHRRQRPRFPLSRLANEADGDSRIKGIRDWYQMMRKYTRAIITMATPSIQSDSSTDQIDQQLHPETNHKG